MVVAVIVLHRNSVGDGPQWATYFVLYLHVFTAISLDWPAVLFQFVQIPTMPKIPAELKPAVSNHIAPEALFWFRWAAFATIVSASEPRR